MERVEKAERSGIDAEATLTYLTGVDVPPFEGNCPDEVVAVIKQDGSGLIVAEIRHARYPHSQTQFQARIDPEGNLVGVIVHNDLVHEANRLPDDVAREIVTEQVGPAILSNGFK